MAKQLNVNLQMTADTSQATQQLKSLQAQLTQLITSASTGKAGLGLTKDIQEATTAASKLQIMLKNATNSAGTLDLGQLNQAIQKSGHDLKYYANQLNSLGPQGAQAFSQIAQSINSASVPLKRTNALLSEFATTMKNTVRWQISSSMLHGFMGTIQKAYGYAEDLNKSLNNIRIVTGQSTDQMAAFAKQANKAAQELNTTTTKYTDAALIFYQQGLSDAIVKEYTDVTIKMANVTRDGATEVSSYMTAIWNNFNKDGTESAEHFADVLTALGAATASSTAEISDGLEKFASIADVTGLSYDYAASALATLIANTRQSADVVGTSLKTIFSRIEGLKFGETLEDGVDLNKYSEALAKIGVNVLDATGNLKDLDDILDDTAERWGTLSRAQQMATAQTVAGVRQYNNFISLMDNWDDMEDNLQTARTSDGTLQEQADIYAESWEAARDRVRAAAEAIYQDLLDDDFFITALDGVEHLLDAVDNLIKGLGGIPGVLTIIGGAMLSAFGKDIARQMNDTFYNLTYNTETAKQEILDLRQSAIDAMQTLGDDSIAGSATLDVFKQQGKLQDEILAKTQELTHSHQDLTTEEQQQIQIANDIATAIGKQAIEAAKVREQEEQVTNALMAQAKQTVTKGGGGAAGKAFEKDAAKAKALQQQYALVSTALEKMRKAGKNSFGDVQDYVTKLNAKLNELGIVLTNDVQAALDDIMNGNVNASGDLEEKLDGLSTACDDLGADAQTAFEDLEKYGDGSDKFASSLDQMQQSATRSGTALGQECDQLANLDTHIEQSTGEIQQFNGEQATFADGIVALGTSLTSVASAIMSIKSLGQIWSDDDATIGEKILTTMTTLGMVIPMLTNAFGAENIAKLAGLKLDGLTVAKTVAKVAGVKAEKIAHETNTAAIWKEIAAQMLQNWYYAAIVAVILVLIGVIALLTDAYNKDAEALADANKNLEEAENNYNSATQAAEKFKEAVSSYEDALQGLEKLTAGTDEMANAVADANEKARELIETYKLFDDYSFGDNGEIIIDPDALNEAQANMDRIANQAEQVYYLAKAHQSDKQIDNDATQLGRNTLGSMVEGYGESTTVRKASGEEVQQLASAIDQIRDAEGGVKIEAEELRQRLSENSEEYGLSNSIIRNLNSLVNDETINSLYNFCDAVDEASEANLYYAQQIMNSVAENLYGDEIAALATDEDGHVDEQLANQMQTAVNAILANNTDTTDWIKNKEDALSDDVLSNVSDWDAGDKTEDNIKKFLTGLNSDFDEDWLADNYSKIFEGSGLAYDGDIEAKEMTQAYYEAQGYTITSVKDKNGYTAISGTNGEETFDLDVDNEQAQKLWAEQVAAYAINQMAEQMEAQNLSEDEVTEIFGNITQNGEQYGADFTNALLTSISNGCDAFNFESLYSELSPKEHEELMSMSGEEIAALFGLTEETLKKLGYDDANAFGEAFHTGLEGWSEEDYTSGVNAEYNKKAEDLGIDVDEFEDYRDLLIDTNEVYEDNIEGANMVALANKRLSKGVSSLADKWEDINDIMSDGTSTIEDISTVLPDVNDALQDILNLDTDDFALLPPDFAQKHWDLIQDVMNNVEGSVDTLRDVAGQEILLNVTGALNTDELDAELLELNSNIAAWDEMNDLTVGIQIDPTDQAEFYANCEALVNKAGMTAAQAEAYFASMGYDVEVEEQPVESITQASYSYYELDEEKTEEAGGVPQFKKKPTPITVDRKESASALAIKSITPNGSYGGGIGVNTTAPKTSTAKANSGKKGGGGGSAPKHNTKENKNRDDEIERYHDVTEALEDVAVRLDRVGKAKDRAFGAGKLKNIKSEIALLRQENKLLQQQYNEASSYLKQDKAEAAKYGWTYDKNGDITNYESNMNRLLDKLESETNYYNSLSAEAQKKYDENLDANDKTKLDRLQEEYDKAIAAKDKLEESSDKVRDTLKQMQEVAQQIADAELESIEVIVDLTLEVDDAQLKYLQALFDNIGDSADNAADKIENIEKQIAKFGKQMEHQKEGLESYLKLAKKYSKGLSNDAISNIINGTASDSDLQALAKAVSNSDGTLDMNTIMEKVKDFQSACYENIEQLKEWRDSVYETLQDAMDQYDEKFDRIDNKIAHSSKMIQSYKDLVAAIGKKNVDPTGQLTARMDQNAIKTSESAYRASQAQSEYWKKAVADAQEGLAAAKATGVEADIKYWEDILNDATDKLYESEEDAMSKLNEWVTQLGEAFQHQIEQVIDNLNQSLGGLSDLREAFDRAQEIDAQYIDDYQKIYELSKLTRQVNTSIDETDNVKAKKALMEYQQKINEYQADGVQMSEYELQYLQKQYDLELAKIALNEAQDAKSQVRMTRDSEGNYGYVYTADESAVEKAEQSYEDKLYEMQELNAQYINDLQDNIITMQEEMSSKLQEIAEDDSLSYEEKMAKMQEVTNYYSERIDYYSKQLGIVLDNNKSLYENDWKEYSEKTGYKISKDEDYIDSWGETTIAIQTGAETQEEYIANVKNSMQVACDDMQDALSDYQQAVRDATDEVIDSAAEQTDALAETAEEAAEDAKELEEDYEDTLGEAMDATQQFTEDYAAYINDCIQANLDYIDSINDVLAKLRELAAEEGSGSGKGKGKGSEDKSGKDGDSGSGGKSGSGGGSGAGSVEGVAAAIWMDGGVTSGWYNGNDRTSRLKEKGLTAAQAYINAHGPNGDIYAAWHDKREQLKSFYYGSFDTGGYTGEWGDGSGKLALLHSKELVLNAADTENMLKMVDMVRQISNMIDINALSSSLTSGLTAASVNANNNGVLEQQVTITAEFPNATDKDQILDAFDNVINLAAQYANRK